MDDGDHTKLWNEAIETTVIERDIAAQSALARIRKVRDGYANQAKFADVEQASYFREFIRKLDEAVGQKESVPQRVPDHGGADTGVRKTAPYNIKAIATVISLSYGEDPEADAELGRMCTADNKPVKCWEVYEEQAKALFAWLNAVLDSLSKPAPVAAEDEAYELGKCYGYEDAIQDLDIATGGDGEFKGSTISGETVDVETMKQRIVERFANASAEARLRVTTADGFIVETMPSGRITKIIGKVDAHPHTSDCDKQGTTTFNPVLTAEHEQEVQSLSQQGRTGGLNPPTGANPSDRTADVKCEACSGTGRHMGRFSMNDPDCTYCRGKGKVRP